MKNRTVVSGSVLFVEMDNVTPSVYMSCSVDDIDVIKEYRWRVIDGSPVTTKTSGTLEYRHTFDSIVLGVDRNGWLTRRDKNVLNCQRTNLSMSPSKRENVILRGEDVSYIVLPNAQTVLIDTEDMELVSQYLWYSIVYRGHQVVMSRYMDKEATRKVQLPRLLLQLDGQSSRSVKHHNGDRLDCRKQNLYIVNSKGDDHEGT